MTKKVDTWMPFLVDKYLGDTTHLNTEQHGAYFLMLLSMWKKDGVLPLDDGQLASITRLAPAKWRAHKPVLLAFFTASPDGSGITQKRLSVELERAKATSAAKAEAGAKGAGKRWHGDGTAIAQPLADGSQSASQTDAPIPIPIEGQEKPTAVAVGGARPSADPPPLALVEKPKAPKPAVPDCPHLAVLALWAEVLPQLPQHLPDQWRGARADHLRARWRETAAAKRWPDADAGLTFFRRLFGFVGQSPFLTGRATPATAGRKPFVAELAWLVLPENWAKTIEGKYHPEAAEA